MKFITFTTILTLSTFAISGRETTTNVPYNDRIESVTNIPNLVAFWDFVERENGENHRFIAHTPNNVENNYPLDVLNYVKDYWGEGRKAEYSDFPLMGRGPFGQAIQFKNEKDGSFRPLLLVPRSRLHNTPLDIKGKDASVTVVVWTIRESGNHALAGIWHEGTDLKQASTVGMQKVEPGQRQYALFAGLAFPGTACGHVSENGVGSFTYKYASHKCHSGDVSPEVSASSAPEVLDHSWSCFAMTFDNEKDEITGWLNGQSSSRWETNLEWGMMERVRNAWRQGRWHQMDGLQEGEDPDYPKDQFYNPPEGVPLKISILSETQDKRIELREYKYSKVKVVLEKDGNGIFSEKERDIFAISLNPWWYPHGIYSPKDDGSGGPFTIGRVIHSARESGFSGWMGGVAVFDRALSADEIKILSGICKLQPLHLSESKAVFPGTSDF